MGNPTQIPAADAKKLPANPTVEKLVKDIKQKYDAENAVEVVSNSPVELMEIVKMFEFVKLTSEDTADGKLWEQVYLNSFTLPSMKAAVIGYMNDLHTLKANDRDRKSVV